MKKGDLIAKWWIITESQFGPLPEPCDLRLHLRESRRQAFRAHFAEGHLPEIRLPEIHLAETREMREAGFILYSQKIHGC